MCVVSVQTIGRVAVASVCFPFISMKATMTAVEHVARLIPRIFEEMQLDVWSRR